MKSDKTYEERSVAKRNIILIRYGSHRIHAREYEQSVNPPNDVRMGDSESRVCMDIRRSN